MWEQDVKPLHPDWDVDAIKLEIAKKHKAMMDAKKPGAVKSGLE